MIRIDNTLTIYLSAITESFISFLNPLRININQRLDKSISANVTDYEKLGCLIFYKKSTGPKSEEELEDFKLSIAPFKFAKISE